MLHVRMLRRAASGEYDLAPDQLFSTIEQLLFTKVLSIAEKEGKPVRLAVAAANDLWEGILRTAANLQSSTIVAGSSAKTNVTEQAREIGLAWERMPEPRPRVTLEIFTPSGQEQIFYLGPHAPRLTPKEIDLLHKIWLELGDKLPGEGNSPPRHRSFRADRSGTGTEQWRKRRRSRSPARTHYGHRGPAPEPVRTKRMAARRDI